MERGDGWIRTTVIGLADLHLPVGHIAFKIFGPSAQNGLAPRVQAGKSNIQTDTSPTF